MRSGCSIRRAVRDRKSCSSAQCSRSSQRNLPKRRGSNGSGCASCRRAQWSQAIRSCCAASCAGAVNVLLALFRDSGPPPWPALLCAGVVGLLGYGLRLVLFVLALRHLGTARTGAYFAIAPFFGGILAVLFFGDAVTLQLCISGVLMAIGLCF